MGEETEIDESFSTRTPPVFGSLEMPVDPERPGGIKRKLQAEFENHGDPVPPVDQPNLNGEIHESQMKSVGHVEDTVEDLESLGHCLDDEMEKDAVPNHEYKTSEKARENSRKWHQKWISKGVPRVSASTSTPTPSAATAAAAPSNPPLSDGGVSLAKVKDQFISKWIKESNMAPSNERRAAAIKAWMASQERANFLAGREGVQK